MSITQCDPPCFGANNCGWDTSETVGPTGNLLWKILQTAFRRSSVVFDFTGTQSRLSRRNVDHPPIRLLPSYVCPSARWLCGRQTSGCASRSAV